MRRLFTIIMMIVASAVISDFAFAVTIRVGPGETYTTIQDGINAAADGDTVLVADGVYRGIGNVILNFHNKVVTVKSENGPENCIHDRLLRYT